MRYFTQAFRRHLALILLLITGGAARLYLLPSSVWTGDSARDLLVSSHILRFHEYPVIGHAASGTNPMFFYPPVYYYLLSLLQILSSEFRYVLTMYVLINLVGMAAFYFTVIALSDNVSAVVATLLLMFSSYVIDRQTSLTSMGVALPILLSGTYFHAVGTLRRSLRDTLVGFSFLIVASSINYAALILLPVYIFWSVWGHHKTPVRIMIIGMFAGTYAFLLFYPFMRHVIQTHGFSFFIAPFLPQNNIAAHNVLASVLFQIRFAFSILFPFMTGFIILLTVSTVAVRLVSEKKSRIAILYPLSIVGITIFLSSVKNVPVATHYYYLALPFLIMIIGMAAMAPAGRVARITGVILIEIACLSGVSGVHGLLIRNTSFSDAARIVDSIIGKTGSDMPLSPYISRDKFRIIALHSSNLDWESLKFTYFQEHKLGKLYTVSDKSQNNLIWTGPVNPLVMICLTDPTTTLNWCREEMHELYPEAEARMTIYSIPPYPVIVYANDPKSY